MDLRRSLKASELEREAQRIMDGESGSDNDGIDIDSDNSLDEYEPSGSEHYTSSDEEEPYVLEEKSVTDNNDRIGGDGPRSKKMRKIPTEFDWKFDTEFTPKCFEFDTTNSGVTHNNLLNETCNELDFFVQFFDETLMTLIVEETNIYGKKRNEQHEQGSNWRDVELAELYRFFGLCILMGIIEKPNLKDYWSTNNLIRTRFFSAAFSRDRFLDILYSLHFSSNEKPEDGSLKKIKSVVDLIKAKFSSTFYPFQDLCIDESLILWKGRLSFKQYIPSKRNRFGIKLFEICDVESGYILGFIIYTGSSTILDQTMESLEKSGQIVDTLMKEYYNRKHILYVDNWYTSPELFEYLLKQDTGGCGTVKATRKGMPQFRKPIKKGEVETACTDNLLAVKWFDKKFVHMLTSVSTPHLKETGKVNWKTGDRVLKPQCVLDYNKKMGAVDKIDMQISFVDCARKSLKWYKKLFFHLMDLCLYNAYLLFQVVTGKKTAFSDFRLKVVAHIFEKYPSSLKKRSSVCSVDNPLRLIERHFPCPVQQTAAQGSRTQRRCHVCATTQRGNKKRSDTRFMCKECNVALCVYPCFEKFHTVKKF